jgi:hypothetical protein
MSLPSEMAARPEVEVMAEARAELPHRVEGSLMVYSAQNRYLDWYLHSISTIDQKECKIVLHLAPTFGKRHLLPAVQGRFSKRPYLERSTSSDSDLYRSVPNLMVGMRRYHLETARAVELAAARAVEPAVGLAVELAVELAAERAVSYRM